MYKLAFSQTFLQKLDKLAKKDREIRKRVKKTLQIFAENPFYPSLKTHKVDTRLYGKRWSSIVTGNLRVIWDFEGGDKQILLLFTIGGHSGKDRVYK